MKTLISNWNGKTSRVSFCSAGADERQKIEIAGLVLEPDEDSAYVEFYLSHCWPVVNKYRTGILPQVVANSHLSLKNKVFNLGHLMRKYNPKAITRDRILGTVVAVEFVDGEGTAIAELTPEGGFTLAGDIEKAQGIRAVAVMHKAAEGVLDILASWFSGEEPITGEWSVSIENSFYEEDCGFIVRTDTHLKSFVDGTPQFLRDAGWVYVPCMTAPEDLLACLNNADDNRSGNTSTRIERNYKGCETVLLLGGLDGKIRYRGVALTPGGAREAEARVSTMLASAPMVDVEEALNPLRSFGESIFGKK